MNDVEFVDGLIVKQPHPNAPDFVKAKISIKREDLLQWLQNKKDEWINIDIKESKTGKWYAQVDTWQPQNPLPSGQDAPPIEENTNDAESITDVPF